MLAATGCILRGAVATGAYEFPKCSDGGTSEIMKTIIAREVTGVRT
jgi:hypothetical protein